MKRPATARRQEPASTILYGQWCVLQLSRAMRANDAQHRIHLQITSPPNTGSLPCNRAHMPATPSSPAISPNSIRARSRRRAVAAASPPPLLPTLLFTISRALLPLLLLMSVYCFCPNCNSTPVVICRFYYTLHVSPFQDFSPRYRSWRACIPRRTHSPLPRA